jgi:uncharacterized protein YgbK (DUF1537 family)
MHKRSELRSAVVTALTGATAAGSRVFGDRALDLWATELPAILVYAREEQSERMHVSSDTLKRRAKFSIEAIAQGNDSLDQTLDDMAEAIEATINADPTLAEETISTTLTQTELLVDDDGEKTIGAVRMTYEILYQA